MLWLWLAAVALTPPLGWELWALLYAADEALKSKKKKKKKKERKKEMQCMPAYEK